VGSVVTTFRLEWEAGASAQLELFSPVSNQAGGVYQLKYTPPFRSTLRPPVDERPLGPGELDPINERLEKIANDVGVGVVRAPSGGGPHPAAAAPADPTGTMEMVGAQLFDIVLSRAVQTELRTREIFLEIGVDQDLLDYPWELMHDGEDYLCNKHFVGRFVNVSERPIPPAGAELVGPGKSLGRLSMLLISVPQPQPRADGVVFDKLPEAEAETDAIVETLAGADGVDLSVLSGKKASFDAVYSALKQEPFHIIHYSGHARFREDNSSLSGLVLHDRDMTTGPLVSFFGSRPPILTFLNACQTGQAGRWKEHYSIYSLARAFLETGTYLVGSRWPLDDKAAREFASSFYKELLVDGRALGVAVGRARAKCRDATPKAFGWASYVLYGDPRLSFWHTSD
jgi:CHAT domain-containing protein